MAEQISYRLTVSEVIAQTREARTLVFERIDLAYRPGQFLTLRIPSDRTGSVARCYSLCSSPHTDECLMVTVKRTTGGYASNWLCDNVKSGTTLETLAPAGIFTPRTMHGDLLLLAAGSGITPIMSIIKSALAEGTGALTLIYANRGENSVIFRDELRALAAHHPARLTVIHWLESVQGLPTATQLHALVSRFTPTEVMICGPKPFMAAARSAVDLPKSRVHLERFISLGANPFDRAVPTVPDVPDEPDGGRPSTLEVNLDGTRHALAWPAHTKLLDLLLDHGLPAPYSCREGACSACACRLVRGEVKMLDNEVLDREDLDDGIILACQSLPVTQAIEISYE
jgi:3-ketosteroid 9alpha-monooxygenase subunit B